MTILMQDAMTDNNNGMDVADMQPSLKDVLNSIRSIPYLQPQERRVVLRELVASCDENDTQILQRLLGQTTKSGFDVVSALPVEVSHKIFLYLEGMDLVRCRAVCRPWRALIKGDSGLWKTKIMAWNPAECAILIDNYPRSQLFGARMPSMSQKRMDGQVHNDILTTTAARRGGGRETKREILLDNIANQLDFIGWELTMIQELALKQNWRHGRYAYEMTMTLAKNIKPIILAWPFLILVDEWPKLYKISLKDVRRDRFRVIPVGDKDYTKVVDLQDYGSVSCVAWDSFSFATGLPDLLEEHSQDESHFPLAFGGFLRSVRLCNPDTKTGIALPDVHHSSPLHLCFLRDQILSVTLDGQITFFQKGMDYRPQRSCTVETKVLQIAPVNFGEKFFEREHNGDIVSWREVICLGYEDGVIIKDEHSHTLCHILLEVGSKLLQFQAIADDTPPYRNELLILFEDPNTRLRRVLRVKLRPGYESEISRSSLTPNFSLGRGGDARDSIAMYRDRIAIVSHRTCSSDLGHYCVLRLLDLQEDIAISTEYAQNISGESEDEEEEVEEEEGMGTDRLEESENERIRRLEAARIPKRGRLINLNDFAGHKAACRVLAMDHARIVLGMGPKVVKILCLV
ncbi:hypothetical protein BGZ79_001899 [Entomortierella chlamydospora]|nr:hypothetical protein BGZ79_001899 [Entomortierella chlamydospora]